MKLSEHFAGGDVVKDGDFFTLGYVDSEYDKTLSYCDKLSYLHKANANDHVGCVIITKDMINEARSNKGVVVSPNPRKSFYELHLSLLNKGGYGKRLDYAVGKNCRIHPSAVVSEKTKIGDHVVISEKVVIKDEVEIGNNTFIDAGAVIGCEGLLYFVDEGDVVFVKHAGGVKIGAHVSILSNAIIAKSVHDSFLTTVGDNAIIGVSTNIGHEAQVGRNCVISSNCVIARRARINENAWIGTSSVVREHIEIGKFAQIKLGSVVIEDVGEKQSVSGNFAMDHHANLFDFMRKSNTAKNK